MVNLSMRNPTTVRWTTSLIIAIGLLISVDRVATAQMFGNRNVGETLSRRSSPGAASEAELLTGSERFLRDNRDPSQFIGSPQSTGGFVGMIEASDPGSAVISAVQNLPGIRPDRSAIINRPLNPRRPNSMMPPQLSLGTGLPDRTNVGRVPQVQTSLDRLFETRFENQFEVSVEGPVAILRGVARDEGQRQLVEILTSMEPGIDEVRNLIEVGSYPLPEPTFQPTNPLDRSRSFPSRRP